jgi:hypothetical protein
MTTELALKFFFFYVVCNPLVWINVIYFAFRKPEREGERLDYKRLKGTPPSFRNWLENFLFEWPPLTIGGALGILCLILLLNGLTR